MITKADKTVKFIVTLGTHIENRHEPLLDLSPFSRLADARTSALEAQGRSFYAVFSENPDATDDVINFEVTEGQDYSIDTAIISYYSHARGMFDEVDVY